MSPAEGRKTLVFLAVAAAVATAAACAPPAFGHGLGVDTTPPIAVDGTRVAVTVEIPSYDTEGADERQVTVSAADVQTGQAVPDVTYRIGLLHGGDTLFRDRFFAEDGTLSMNVKRSGDGGAVSIDGIRDASLGAWRASPERPLEITGPVFESGGLYTFEIELGAAAAAAAAEDGDAYAVADITLVESAEFVQNDGEDNPVTFWTKSYFDSVDSFEYDADAGTVTLGMPFDWREKRISHIPVVHVEIRFPKDFAEFLAPSYTGTVNGIDLFKSSVVIDDYTKDSERIVHFVLLNDHIRHVKNQLERLDEPAGDRMIFTLQTGEGVDFPISAWTRDESYQVDLFWDPLEIRPEQPTKFVFTIRDGATAEPLRNSGFDFVILQGGKEIHRQSGNARVGGDFVDYTFAEDQTGPTVIRFEDIRGSGRSTEFGIVVVPEFGLVAALILAAGVTSVTLLSATRRLPLHGH